MYDLFEGFNIETKHDRQVVSHENLAEQLGLYKGDVKDRIEKYEEHLLQYSISVSNGNRSDDPNQGLLSEKVKIQAGAMKKYKTVYFLDEQQAMFIISLCRPTEEVLTVRKRLIKAFFRMREQLEQDKELEKYIAIKGLVSRVNKQDEVRSYQSTIARISYDYGLEKLLEHIDLGLKEVNQYKKEKFIHNINKSFRVWWKKMTGEEADKFGTPSAFEHIRAELEKRYRMFVKRSRGHLIGEH